MSEPLWPQTALAVLLGLVVGSFLNVTIYRLPRGLSLTTPGSFCPRCRRRLGPGELVPVISFLLQRGRCRSCRARISPQYPLVEAGTAAGYAVLWLATGEVDRWLPWAVLLSLLVGLSLIDLQHRILPDRLTGTGMLTGILFAALGWTVPLNEALLGVGAGLLAGLFIVLASRGGMGFGDAKLLAAIGAYLGPWGALGSLIWGSVLGSLVGIALLLAKRVGRRDPLPFGPFLAAGALLAAWTVPYWLGWAGLGG